MILGAVLMISAAPVAAQENNKKEGEKPKPAEAKQAPDKGEAAEGKAAEPAAPKAAAKTAKSDAALTLARLSVCKDVEDRAPVGEAESFDGVHQLYAFTRIEGAHTPTQVYHRWYVGEKMVNEIPINVKGPRWRCWSKKTIQPGWSGNCKVEVVTEEGDVLGSKSFMLASANPGMMKKEEAKAKAPEAKAAGEAKAEEAKDDHAGHDHDDHAGHDHD